MSIKLPNKKMHSLNQNDLDDQKHTNQLLAAFQQKQDQLQLLSQTPNSEKTPLPRVHQRTCGAFTSVGHTAVAQKTSLDVEEL